MNKIKRVIAKCLHCNKWTLRLLLFALNCYAVGASAQLEKLPKVEVSILSPSQISDLPPLVLTTFPKSALTKQNDGSEAYPACIQIIDPLRPWPPIWYLSSDNGIFGNAQSYPGGLLSYTRDEYSPKATKGITGSSYNTKLYILKNFRFVDSIDKKKLDKPIDGHDFRVNEKGEKLIFSFIDTLLNISELTNGDPDSGVLSRVGLIVMLNKYDQVTFLWDPLKYIPLNERYVVYKGIGGNRHVANVYDWNHANSVAWADDGNIIYSFRNIGVGKVNAATGQLIWQLGAQNHGIHLIDSVSFFGQHDFRQIQSGPYKGKYSVLSNGNDEHQFLSANVYDIDEKKMTATLLHKFFIDSSAFSHGAGSYAWVKNMQITCYGYFDSPGDNNNEQPFGSIADSSNKILATYYLPSRIYSSRLETGQNLAPLMNERPVIKRGKGFLFVDSIAPTLLTWFEITDKKMNCQKAGEGDKFYPQKPGIYFVTKRLALGTIVSELYYY